MTRSGAIKTPHLTVMKRNVTKTKSNIKEKESNHYSTKKDPYRWGQKGRDEHFLLQNSVCLGIDKFMLSFNLIINKTKN